ncbi:MAG: hypothetical protein AAGE18_15015 [Pseudomonadota bacterium]
MGAPGALSRSLRDFGHIGNSFRGLAALAGLITIVGQVSDVGAVCRAVRGDDGQLYTFQALPADLAAGDRVVIEATPLIDRMSVCDQGREVIWQSVTRTGPDRSSETIWRRSE